MVEIGSGVEYYFWLKRDYWLKSELNLNMD